MAALATQLSKIAMNLAEPKILAAGYVEPNPLWHMAAHSHRFHEIIVVLRGRLRLTTGDGQIVAKPGDILFYRAGMVHEETSDPRAPVRSCFIALATGDSLPWLPLHTHDHHGRIHQLVVWIVEDEQKRRAPEMRRSLIETLFGELRRICVAPPDPWIEAVLDYIRKNFAQPITLDDLARRGQMSKFAFVRKFKRLSGRTPMEELRHTRLNQARTLLLTTNLPVKAIAPAVGIGDEYQLSKLFRMHFQLSPRDLRLRK